MLAGYVRIALRVLLRQKRYTLVSLVGIGITLMVLIVTTAVLDTVWGHSLMDTRRSRTLGLYTIFFHRHAGPPGTHIFPSFQFLTRHVGIKGLENAERASIFTLNKPVAVYREDRRVKVQMRRTDADYWRVFDFEFLEGRPFTPTETEDANLVAVINRSIRDRFFGPEPAAGKILELGGQRFTVIGVVENVPGYRSLQNGEVWAPVTTLKGDGWRNPGLTGWFRAAVVARSRRHIPLLKEEFRSRAAFVKPDRADYLMVEAELETYFEALSRMEDRPFGEYGRPHTRRDFLVAVLLMFGFMLIPAVNMVNINVSRILERAPEIGVRRAFGATTRTLVGQFVVENIVLTALGGALGVALSAAVLHFLNRCGWIPYARFGLNPVTLLYALLLILFFGVLSGIYPAWKMARLHPVEALRGGAR